MKFAKAIHCLGVDKWFVRLGERHGMDVMYEEHSENIAKIKAKIINDSLTRRIKAVEKRRETKKYERTNNILSS